MYSAFATIKWCNKVLNNDDNSAYEVIVSIQYEDAVTQEVNKNPQRVRKH